MHVGDVDFGFSVISYRSLCFGITYKKSNSRIVKGKEISQENIIGIANDMHSLHRQIPHLRWFIDGANRGAVNECKAVYGERID